MGFLQLLGAFGLVTLFDLFSLSLENIGRLNISYHYHKTFFYR